MYIGGFFAFDDIAVATAQLTLYRPRKITNEILA